MRKVHYNDLGQYHNEHGPAIIENDDEFYYIDDKLHREDGPAIIIFVFGQKEKFYYQNGLRHRNDGPAIITKSKLMWFKWGKLHREDGPAIVNMEEGCTFCPSLGGGPCCGGDGQIEWWLDGGRLTEDEYWEKQKNTEHCGKIFAMKFTKNYTDGHEKS